MPLFTDTKGFKPVKENPFKQEKEMQRAVEANLPAIYGLQRVTSEFAPQGDLRIDTLAYDPEQCSFVIIEYKKGSSWSVIDQGYAYLALMLNNKADFVLKFNECTGKNFNLKDINWEASRVFFISPSFNAFQRESLGFQDLPFELWEIRRYEGNLISLNQLQASKRSAKLSDVNVGSSDARTVQREVKQYTIEDHFNVGWERSRELYDALSAAILNLEPRFKIKAAKHYIGFQIDGSNVVSIKSYKSKIVLELIRMQPQDFKDPEKRVVYREKSFHYFHVHISMMTLTSEDEIPYAIMLAKQTLEHFNK